AAVAAGAARVVPAASAATALTTCIKRLIIDCPVRKSCDTPTFCGGRPPGGELFEDLGRVR
ncbi:hypothetical protein, partial [Nonomuraea rhizosphaerae]|uniref:hypothetical protein n=1 Tax=Nonomuraea rhizosphaerae TaxID=2665663 RepID=UPI001C5DDB81